MPNTISFITINRNDAGGLARTVQSLNHLRHEPGVEFVFIDGASTDESLSVALSFYRSNEITSQKDRGIYHAMNKGLRRATGDYVVWINSGDEISRDPRVIEKVRRSKDGMLAFSVEVVYQNEPSRNYIEIASEERLPQSTLFHAGVYFKRSDVIDAGGYREKWRIVADRDLILRMARRGASISYNDEVAAHFFNGGASSALDTHYLETIRLNHEHGLISTPGLLARLVKYKFVIRPRAKAGQRL